MAPAPTPSQERWTLALVRGERVERLYEPTNKGAEFHDLTIANAILEGPRGTGKSLILRFDAHMHALMAPGMAYLIVRRTMPELRKSHLRFIEREMASSAGCSTEPSRRTHDGSRGALRHSD
jgi:hypothetical protein